MADNKDVLYCHKDLTQECKRTACPMWFVPPNPRADGDCAECLNEKQTFWETIKTAVDEQLKDTAQQSLVEEDSTE